MTATALKSNIVQSNANIWRLRMSFRSALLFVALVVCALPLDAALMPDSRAFAAQQSKEQKAQAQEIQGYLKRLGFYAGDIDGIWGKGSADAFAEFIQLAGLSSNSSFNSQVHFLKAAAEIAEAKSLGVKEAIKLAPDFQRAVANISEISKNRKSSPFSDMLILYVETAKLLDRTIGESSAYAINFYIMAGLAAYGDGNDDYAIYFFEKAFPYLLENPEIAEKKRNDAIKFYISAYGQKASAAYSNRRYGESETLNRKALEIAQKVFGRQSEYYINILNNLAIMVELQVRLDDAEAIHREALALSREVYGRNSEDVAISMTNLAIVLNSKGIFPEAEQLYRQALGVFRSTVGSEHPHTLSCMTNLAAVLSSERKYAEAEQIDRQLLDIKKRLLGLKHSDTLAVMGNLAVVLVRQGKLKEAEEFGRQAAELSQDVLGIEHPDTLSRMSTLAVVLGRTGKASEAEKLDRQILTARRRVLGQGHPETIDSLINLAGDLSKQSRFAEAVPLNRTALEQRQRTLGSAHPDTLHAVNNLALAQLGTVDRAAALSTWEDGFAAITEFFALGLGSTFKQRTGQIPLDIPLYLDVAKTASLPSKDAATRTFAAQGWLNYGPLDVALADLGARLSVGDAAEAKALRNRQQARDELQDARQAYLKSFDQKISDDQRNALSQRVSDAEEQFTSASDYLSKTYPQLADLQLPRALTADEAQSLLQPGEGLVAYAATDKVLYAWLITKDHVEWRQIPLAKSVLTDKVGQLRRSLDLTQPAPKDSAKGKCALSSSVAGMEERPFDLCLAKDLHNQLLGSFDLSGLDELIVVPSGPLEQLPFSLLVTSIDSDGTPHWLIEDHAISVLPTTSSLRALRQASPVQRNVASRSPFLGVAPVSFDGVGGSLNLRSTALTLPNTKDEITFISALLSGGSDSVVLGDKASEAFIDQAPLDRYEVISFATHALLSKEAKTFTDGAITEPALLLRAGDGQDGFLTATEIASLRLDADWVLLSACNTGAGGSEDAEGLTGLARAFFFAGARSLLVSNWSVDDSAAKELMIQTMQNSAANHMSRSQALRQAMLNVMQAPDRDFRHPFFWAPFSLVGDNR